MSWEVWCIRYVGIDRRKAARLITHVSPETIREAAAAKTSSDEVSKGGRGKRGGNSQLARELGVSEPTVRRALKQDNDSSAFFALTAAWNRATEAERRIFLHHIGATRRAA
jgi:hypothetical protein